tara:strand:- start:734 stop:1021 length:288 start_codon:yes stop_codon:yes gene_type:complete
MFRKVNSEIDDLTRKEKEDLEKKESSEHVNNLPSYVNEKYSAHSTRKVEYEDTLDEQTHERNIVHVDKKETLIRPSTTSSSVPKSRKLLKNTERL